MSPICAKLLRVQQHLALTIIFILLRFTESNVTIRRGNYRSSTRVFHWSLKVE